MAVSYTKVYEDSTSVPSGSANTYDVANPLPAGLIEAVGVRWSGTTAAANMALGDQGELVSALRMTLNGDQWLNFNPLGGNNDQILSTSRMGAIVQDVGGSIATDGSLTNQDTTIWIPCGISVPQNSRFELHIGFIAGNVAMTSGARFSVWIKYGHSSSATIIGNMTSETLAADTQTLVSVKIPTYQNAVVSGIVAQCPTQADNLTSAIIKPLGDFALTPTQIRSASGAQMNGYQYMAPSIDTTENMWANAPLGYYFIPLYDLASTDGNVILLITASAAQTWTFTPILSLPTGGSGEAQPRQTASAKTGGAKTILTRAEEDI